MTVHNKGKSSKISIAETVDPVHAQQTVLNLIDYAVTIYESGDFGVENGTEEAHALVFAKELPLLQYKTVAQWITSGMPEKRARDAIKDYVDEVRRTKKIQVEEKKVIAKVFGSGRR